MKRVSIKWKIFSYMLGFCALLLLILWIFQTVLLDTFYRKIKLAEIEKNANSIAKNINDESTISNLINSICEENGYYIEIIDEDIQQYISSGDKKSRLRMEERERLLSNIKNGEYIEYLVDEPENNMGFKEEVPKKNHQMQSIVYLKKVTNTKVILINAMISPVDATVTTLRYQLYYITVIMILLSVILAIIISKRVSKPIERLNTSAKSLAKGDYNIEFSDTVYKEIGELSDTLNIAAKELNKVEKYRRELMGNISHDLRTPLSLIYGYAEVMQDFPKEITQEQTQTIMDETQRLSSLVNDVFHISNLESGILKLNISTFNFTKSIKEKTEGIKEFVKKDGYNIIFNYDKEVIVKGDEIKLINQVYYNLLINAINYTGNDKVVIVNQLIDGDNVIIEVKDSGEGITKDNLTYIWDRYYKVDKTHKRAVTGTGLGLSIVKKIIDLHHGKYGVDSKVNIGSRFWFSVKIEDIVEKRSLRDKE